MLLPHVDHTEEKSMWSGLRELKNVQHMRLNFLGCDQLPRHVQALSNNTDDFLSAIERADALQRADV